MCLNNVSLFGDMISRAGYLPQKTRPHVIGSLYAFTFEKSAHKLGRFIGHHPANDCCFGV